MVAVNKRAESLITQEYLKSILSYDLTTGLLTWVKRTARNIEIGSVAGSTHKLTGYVSVGVQGRRYQVHRLVFRYVMGNWPPQYVDHINHNRSDNRWVNLRLVDRTDNMRNQLKYINNKSGRTGVYYDETSGKWRAQIRVAGRGVYLGCFHELEDAIVARDAADTAYDFHNNHGNDGC